MVECAAPQHGDHRAQWHQLRVQGDGRYWWAPSPPHPHGQQGTSPSRHLVLAGWEVAGDYIYTAAGASDNDFMILTLVVPGFR